MADRPILETLRAVLKFKATATIAEVASMAGVPRRQVLDIINRNGTLVWRNRDNGKISRVDPRSVLRDQLWKSGKFYAEDTYGAWSVEGQSLKFEGNPELREKLQERRTVGALGDNYPVSVIIDTPENRAVIEAAGLRPWAEAVIDDSLWQEDAA